jgi:hypothetical protein
MEQGSTSSRSVRQKAERPGTPPPHFTSSPLRAVLGDVALGEGAQDNAAEVLQELLQSFR